MTIAFAHSACALPRAHRMMRPDREAATRMGFSLMSIFSRAFAPARASGSRICSFHPGFAVELFENALFFDQSIHSFGQ